MYFFPVSCTIESYPERGPKACRSPVPPPDLPESGEKGGFGAIKVHYIMLSQKVKFVKRFCLTFFIYPLFSPVRRKNPAKRGLSLSFSLLLPSPSGRAAASDQPVCVLLEKRAHRLQPVCVLFLFPRFLSLRKICAAEFSHSEFRLLGSSKKSMAFRMRYPFSLYHGFVGCWTMMIFLKESRTCSNAACSCIIFPLSGMAKAD